MYGNEDGSIPATYQILYMIGWKPSVTQVIQLRFPWYFFFTNFEILENLFSQRAK